MSISNNAILISRHISVSSYQQNMLQVPRRRNYRFTIFYSTQLPVLKLKQIPKLANINNSCGSIQEPISYIHVYLSDKEIRWKKYHATKKNPKTGQENKFKQKTDTLKGRTRKKRTQRQEIMNLESKTNKVEPRLMTPCSKLEQLHEGTSTLASGHSFGQIQ